MSEHPIYKLGFITEVMPFYSYSDECCQVMSLLNKRMRKLYQDNSDNFHRKLKKRTLYCHYPLFERVVKALEKNNRWAQFKLDIQIKFPKDFPIMDKFLRDHHNVDQEGKITSTVEFNHLHLVITEESLADANTLLETLMELKMIDLNDPDSHTWLDSSNYCRAANMGGKLRFETEMIVGAEPSAFFEKTEEAGLIDVRNVSRCPFEQIDFPIHAITVDKEFCDALESGDKELKDKFANTVKKAIFEDKAESCVNDIDAHVEHLKAKFPNLKSIEHLLTGEELKEDMVYNMFQHPFIRKVDYQGCDAENTIKISGNNIFFVVGTNLSNIQLKAGEFSIEFPEDAYKYERDLVIIDQAKINVTIDKIVRDEGCPHYQEVAETDVSKNSIIIHAKFIQDLYFTKVMNQAHEIKATNSLKLYLDEQEEYKNMTDYLENRVSSSLPVTLELDMAFIDNMQASKDITDLIFSKMLVKLDIVMEMHFPEYVDHIYNLVKNSTTLVEVKPILHMNCAKTIELVRDAPNIKQWIMDIRLPNEDLRDDIKKLFLADKNNKLVMRDVQEFIIEFRFPSSFQIDPMI